jgi:hypothetical protein
MKLSKIFAVLITSLWITFSVQGDQQYVFTNSDMNQQEQSDGDTEEHCFQFQSAQAIQSIPQINVDFQSFLLDEIELGADNPKSSDGKNQFTINLSKKWVVTHERIISPNAP